MPLLRLRACDDLDLAVEDGRITAVASGCERAHDRFLGFAETPGSACTIAGQPATLEEGIAAAARLLLDARYPLICGLENTTCEAQQLAARLAKLVRGAVDSGSPARANAMSALQRVGMTTATLGEVIERADLVVFWGADPAESHPRLFELLTRDGGPARGLAPLVPPYERGAPQRQVIVVGTKENETSRRRGPLVRLRTDADFEGLWTLRALTQGLPLAAAHVETATGVSLAAWQQLCERLKSARLGAIFFDEQIAEGSAGAANCEALFALARDLNVHTRIVCCPLGEPGNARGAEHVLAWQTGFPGAVDFSQGTPRFLPGEGDTATLLERGEIDAALVIGGERFKEFALPADLELVLLAGSGLPNEAKQQARVIRVADLAVQTAGTIYRSDDTPLPLRPALASSYPSVEAVLSQILQCVAKGRPAEA